MKNMVKFANDNTLAAEDIGDVLIMRKDGKRSVISNVLYIPGMKNNLLSVRQLVEKNCKVLIENLTRVTFNVTIVKSMVIILVIVQKSERIKKVIGE